MKNPKSTVPALLAAIVFLLCSGDGLAQTAPLIKRTTYKSETIEFNVGGSVSVSGAPQGSIAVEGWNRNEIEVSAEIEVQAATEADLARLAEVNGFIFDPQLNHLRITTVGTHDKDYMKKTAKKFPKNLLGMPFRVDYKIKVPRYCDLDITGGDGDFSLRDVDGNVRVNFLKSNASFALVGGSLAATIGEGTVAVSIPTRSWRGRFADVQLASGTMSVQLPLSFSAEVDASILRTGQIENTFAELKPRTRSTKFTEKSLVGRAGSGGVPLKFTVGDGALKIAAFGSSSSN